MTMYIEDLILRKKGIDREIRIDVHNDDEILFQYAEGHCSNCIESNCSSSITVNELFEIIKNKKKYISDQSKQYNQEELDRLNRLVCHANTAMEDQQKEIIELKSQIDSLKTAIKLMKE